MTESNSPSAESASLPTREQLLRFVHRELCELDLLDPTQSPLQEQSLVRRGRPCGSLFHVEGPRALRTSAIWSMEESRIFVYDSTGKRVKQIELQASPAMDSSDRRAA